MRIVVVGDVHGHLQELDELLRVVQFERPDTLVMVGDLVNKGPDSLGVVRRVRELNGTLVRGNHETRYIQGYRKGENPHKLSEDDLLFLRRSPLHLNLPEMGAVVVHGGVPPGLKTLARGRELSDAHERLYRQLPFIKEVEGLFWAWSYDGRFGHCYFGHQPFMQDHPAQYPHATGLDLGCCQGGWLCAAILHSDRPREVVTVRSSRRK